MQINLVYDASVANAPAGFTTAMAAAVSFLDNLFINPITVNIQVGWQEDQGQPFGGDVIGLGGPSDGIDLTYAQLRGDLAANATSGADATALASLPGTDPTNGGRFFVANAQEKALGLLAANATAIDGSVGFGGAVTYTFDPNNRTVPNEIDFIGVAEHELTHAMGRTAGLQGDLPNEFTPLDLFRFAGPGVRQLGPGLPAYFSIDGGATDLSNFDTSSDPGDWASSVNHDSFSSVAYTGETDGVTQADITAMDVIGFSVTGTIVPLTITGTAANQALIDQSTINPFSQVRISDQNLNQTETATVTLSTAANGVLTNLGGGSYVASTGIYTVSGSVAAITAALEGLVFVPTVNQIATGQTVTTGFTLQVVDTAGATAIDSATSVVAVSSGATGGTTNLKTQSLGSGVTFTDSGTTSFGGTPVTWIGKATVTNVPSSLNWTAYSGTMAQEILAATSPVASDIPSTQFTNPALTALGLPFNAAGLALWGDPTASTRATSATDTIAYTFSAAVPAGTPFLLWSPGGSDNGNNGPDTFSFSASLRGNAVGTAGWSFAALSPFGGAPVATYTTNPATGQVIVTNFNESQFPDVVIVATPNTAVDALRVTASTIPFDFWGLALPVAPVTGALNLTGPATVTGVGGATLSIPIDTPANLALLQPMLNGISSGVIGGSILPALTGSPPSIPGGKSGLLQIDSSGAVTTPAGYTTLIDDATGPVTIAGGPRSGQLVVAGKGGLTFNAGSGAGTVFAGGGNNLVSISTGGGAQLVRLGAGNDTVTAVGGDDTINSGAGSNIITLGAGADQVISDGADTVVGGSGSATISAAGASSELVWGDGGALNFINGNGPATVRTGAGGGTISGGAGGGLFAVSGTGTLVGGSGALTVFGGTGADSFIGGAGGNIMVGGAGPSTIWGGSGPNIVAAGSGTDVVISGDGIMTLLGGSGLTQFYQGGSAPVTVVGGSGTLQVVAGSAGGVFAASPNTTIAGGAGAVTIMGSGSGDDLWGGGNPNDMIVAGPGNETLVGAQTSGEDHLFGGSGNDAMFGGKGFVYMAAGTGSAMMVAGSGGNVFAFFNGSAGGSDVLAGFTHGRDEVALVGYAPSIVQTALSSAVVKNGWTTVTLSDNTRITFANVADVRASDFV